MRQLLSTTLLAGLLALVQAPAGAQSEQKESPTTHAGTAQSGDVLTPIRQLFDGMRAGDSTAVRAAFDPIARLVRTSNRDGVPSHHIMPVDDFVKAVGTPHDAVWDEQIWDVKTEVRDNLASVWMKFAFFLGDDFNHCGVNSVELVKTTDGWKIMHLADTAQREGCEMPPEKD